MRIKNKIFTMAFTLLTILSFGVINVDAATTINIDSAEDYANNIEITETTTLRLTNDIDLDEIADGDDEIDVKANLTIDLNGHAIIIPTARSIDLIYHGNHTVNIIDSSVAKTGIIIKNSTDSGIELDDNDKDTANNVTLNIEGIKYISKIPDHEIEIYDSFGIPGQTVNVNIKDSIFDVDMALYYGYSAIDSSFSDVTLNLDIKNSIIRTSDINRNVYVIPNSNTIKYEDIMDAGPGPNNYEVYGDGTKLNDNQALGSTGYKNIEIKKVQRFDITAPTFTATGEGYESIDAEQISITAVGGDRTIRSVQVSGNDFIVAGPIGDTPVNVGTPNTAFTIKPKDDLKYGVHNALIRVNDTVGNVYFAEVSFEVNAYAETQVVTTAEDLRKFTEFTSRDFPVVKTIKLGDDIALDDWLGIYALEEKTLDLNGHTLTTNDIITVVYGTDNVHSYSTGTFNLIDSSDGRTGAIATTNGTSFSLFRISEQYAVHDSTQLTYNFNLDGGTYSALKSSAGIFDFNFNNDWDDNAANRLNFNVKNATFNLNPNKASNLIYLPSEYATSNDLKINLEDITINLKGHFSRLISDKIEYTVGEIIPETQEFVYPNVVDGVVTGTNTAVRTDIASNIKLSYINNSQPVAQMKIQSIKRFDVVAPSFATVTEDYGTVAAQPITITAVGGTKTIANVAVSGDDFYIDGPLGEVEVSSENTQFTIKPKDSFGYGRHTAMITVTDTEGHKYYSEVVFNVIYNSTQIVFDEINLRKFLGADSSLHPEVTTVKLGSNIDITSSWLPIYALDGKTFDLNGFTLNSTWHIGLIFGTNDREDIPEAEFTITDSSLSKTGTIHSTGTQTLLRISREYFGEEQNNYTLNIIGGTYEAVNTYDSIFDIFLDDDWDTEHADEFNFNVSNAHFTLNEKNANNKFIIFPDASNNENLAPDNLKINLTDIDIRLIGSGALTNNANLYGYTVDDIIPETHRIIYPTYVDGIIGSQVAARTDALDDVKLPSMSGALGYQTIKVERIEGFNVIAPTFESKVYGYDDITAAGITIETVGPNRTVKSVSVNDTSKFTVVGDTTPTINSGTSDNTSFTIKPIHGLPAQTHNAIITVTDSDDHIYTAPVTFVVGKADISPSVSITGWTYGEYNGVTNAPSVNGNTGNGDVSYHYVGVDPTVYDSSVAPMNEDVGTYKVQAHIAESDNYAAADCETTFTIAKKTVSFDSSKISFSNKVYNMSSGTTYNIYDTVLDIPTSHYTKNINWIPETKKVGTHKATVTFTINSHYEDNYKFENETNTFTTGEYTYSISTAMTSVETTAEYNDNEEIVKGTSLNLAKYVSLNYDSALKALLEPTYNSDLAGRLEYALVDAPAGVTISGSTLSVDNSVTAGTTIKINVSYPGWDMYDVDGTPELSAASPISIYVKVADKPKHTFDKTPTTIDLVYGEKLLNLYTVTSESGVAVTYTSSDPSVVEIVSTDYDCELYAKKYSSTPVVITVTAPATASHSETSITYQVNVVKRTLSVQIGNYLVEKMYDGTTDPGTSAFGFTIDNDLDEDDINVVGTPDAYTNPNSHSEYLTVTLALDGEDKENYQLPFATIQSKAYISPKSISPTTVYDTTAVYTGSEIRPEVILKVTNDGPVLDASEYEVIYSDNIEVGTNTAKIAIRKTGNNSSLEAGYSNYTWATLNVRFSITKANYPGTVPAITKNVVEQKAGTYYIDYADLGLSNELTDVTYTVSSPDGTFVTAASDDSDNSRISYTVASKNAGTNGSFKVNVSSKNHQDTEFTVTVTAVSKTTVTIGGLSFGAKTYDGNRIVPGGALTADNSYDVTALECLYTGAGYNSALAPINAGTYKLTCSVPESDSNYIGTKEWTFTIDKANPTYDVPDDLYGIVGNSLSTVTLPSGFTWDDDTAIIAAGNQNFDATYTKTGEDADNYNVVENIVVNVYGKNKYNVNTSVIDGNGTISETQNNIIEGTNVEVTFTPATGYMIKSVMVGTQDKTDDVSANKLTLTVNDNLEVKVTYDKIPFTLNVSEVNGATIDPTGTVTVLYGDNKDVLITVNPGYKLISVKVNDVEKIDTLTDGNKLSLTDIKENTNVVVTVEKIVYEVIEGNNHKDTKMDAFRFRFSADYSKFETGGKVYVDDVLIDKINYTSASGSTIITLKEEFVKTLSKDKHIIRVEFNDGGVASANFTVLEDVKETPQDVVKEEEQPTTKPTITKPTTTKPVNNPQTGDNIFTSVIMLVISILGIGISTIVVFGKRKFRL